MHRQSDFHASQYVAIMVAKLSLLITTRFIGLKHLALNTETTFNGRNIK